MKLAPTSRVWQKFKTIFQNENNKMTEKKTMPLLPLDEDTKLIFQQVSQMLDEFDEKYPHLIEQLFAGEELETDEN